MTLTPLRLAGLGLFGFVVAQLLEKLEITVFPGFVKAVGHELSLVCLIILVAGLVLHVIFESVEKHVKPVVEDTFKSYQHVLNTGFDRITTVFSSGFQKIEEVLALKVGAIPSVFKDAFDRALGHIAERNFKTPGVKELVSGGQIDEAVAKIVREEKQESVRKKEEIAALLHSTDPSKWDAAARILDEYPDSREARFYYALAYCYWGASQLNRAIEIGEKGLEYAIQVEDSKVSATLQNSLAYYYADGNRNDKEKEARKYAAEALKTGDAAALDTQGFVLICFGKTREEILKGIDFCKQALEKGGPSQFFFKHVQKAEAKLKALETQLSKQLPGPDPGEVQVSDNAK